jgi:hypothetical protein
MSKRLDEISKRLEEIRIEEKELENEQTEVYCKEVEKLFTWELLSSLEWHATFMFGDKMHVRSFFKGDLKEKYFNLRRKTKYAPDVNIVINSIKIHVGVQGLAIIDIPYQEYLKFSEKLKIINRPDKESRKMLRKTIEALQNLEKI